MTTRITAGHIKLKRAYEPASTDDGVRILFDRLWPRGVKEADAAIDQWIKDIAPSTALRKWFGHDPERWAEFCSRYAIGFHEHPKQFERLRALAAHGQMALVYSAHDEVHNDAVVLRSLLLGQPMKRRRATTRSAASAREIGTLPMAQDALEGSHE